MKKRNIILWIILLAFIDQAVKLIVHHSFMDLNYTLAPDLLEFKPIFNPSYSYWTAKLGANMGIIAHLIMFSLIWAMLIVFYRFYHKVDSKNRLLDVGLIFQTAGFASAYISILFWKDGVLDFMYFKPLNVTCDLKDLYINIFVILWIISTYRFKTNTKDMVKYIKSLFIKA